MSDKSVLQLPKPHPDDDVVVALANEPKVFDRRMADIAKAGLPEK